MNKILNQLKWNLVGNIMFAFSQWVIVVLLTKIGSAEDLGNYSYALALISPIILFFSFDLRRVIATENENVFLSFLTTRIINLFFASFIILIISIFVTQDAKVVLIILSLCIYKFFEYISDIIFGYLQQQNLMESIGISQFFRGILNILFFGSIYYLTSNLMLAINFMNFSMLIMLLFYDVKTIKLSKFNFKDLDFDEYKNIIIANLSLAISLLIISLIVNIPKLYLEYYYGKEILGYFSGIYYIVTIANILLNPVLIILSNNFRYEYNKSMKSFSSFLYKIIFISSTICLIPAFIIGFFGDTILRILYNEEFVIYNNSFIILSISIVFSLINGILSLALITMRKNKSQLFINVINFVISLVIGYILIKNYSILGASLTILLNRMSTSLLLFLNVARFKYKGA